MSSDDTTSTAEDFNSLEVTDTGPKTETQGTVFGVGGVSATGSTERDREIGYSDGRGNPGPNFEAFGGVTNEMGEPVGKVAQTPSEFAAALEATQGGGTTDTTGSISIPSIQAASPNLTPGILGETLSDFQSGVRSGPQVDRDVVDVGAQNMLEAAIASRPRDFSDLDLIPTTGFLPAEVTISDKTGPSTQAAMAATLSMLDQNRNRRAGLGAREGIDFGVTQQLLPATTPTARPENLRQRFDNAAIQEALEAGTLAENLDRSNITEEIDDLADTEFARPRETRTTATGTTRGEDPFDPNVGLPFPVETLERAERLANEKTALEKLGLPSFLSAVDPERVSRDLLATSLIAGRPIGAVEALRGVQAPNLQKETMEEYLERTKEENRRIPESQIITDKSGLVVGIKDAQGNLVTGMDPNAQEVQGDNDNIVRTKAPPKSPTDPCPDGYQLIDGKCTPTGATDTGTGFMMFPADRDPAFRRGPFTPTTVATNPNIRGLNPVTFGLSNIFRR